MATRLHLLKGGHPALAETAIGHQLEAGDRVLVVLLHGAPSPALPAAARVQRVPDDMGYDALLDAVYAADQVVAW